MVKSKKQLSLLVTLVLTLSMMFGCATKTNQDKGKAKEGDEIVELTFAWWGKRNYDMIARNRYIPFIRGTKS